MPKVFFGFTNISLKRSSLFDAEISYSKFKVLKLNLIDRCEKLDLNKVSLELEDFLVKKGFVVKKRVR